MKIRLVVTDLDNTLYSWVDFIVPAMEAMVAEVVAATGLPRLVVIQALKQVYERYGTNEYAFALQESEIYAPYRRDFASFNALVIEPARRAFAAARKKYLRPYRGVRETLVALRDRGVLVAALTDAPRNPAEMRLRQLGLDALVDALYTQPGYALPSQVDADIRQREDEGYYRCAVPRVVELPGEHAKPHPAGLSALLREVGVAPGEALLVGDNVAKDLAVARAVGVHSAWAEYGTYIAPEYLEKLAVFSAKPVTLRSIMDPAELAAAKAARVAALANFGEVLEVIDRLEEA